MSAFDLLALNAALAEGGVDGAALAATHASLFTHTAVTVDARMAAQIATLISAIESVIALPAYQERVLAWAPEIAHLSVPTRGVFFGYDFHLAVDGPKLIEINTNAGGALLNTRLLMAHGETLRARQIEQEFVAMFREEWRLQRGHQPLQCIAIVDENPAFQYLSPEFTLFKHLFEQNRIEVVIADPAHLQCDGAVLLHDGRVIDLVYKRLTDFTLDAAVNADLKAVFMASGVVLTPHPRAHALYADKRNLMLLSDENSLVEIGVPDATRQILLAGIPRTQHVDAAQGDFFWQSRKRWFFKPAAGFGSRAAYRGDKLTKRVFGEILQGDYIAQEIVPPSEQVVCVEGVEQVMKVDVRSYVYNAQVQLLAARLYQGQTTNFRTPGGGFAPVFIEKSE
jgi:hypothetical protein